jgi:carboxymethylenebutenolidase
MGSSKMTITTASRREVTGLLAHPVRLPAPAVILIHGYYGLNEFARDYAAALAEEGFVVLAADLYDGVSTSNDDEAAQLRNAVEAEPARAIETLSAWLSFLREDRATTGRCAAAGWSFGGRWAIRMSMALPVDATVTYVGLGRHDRADLARIKGRVLGHFAELDDVVPRNWVNDLKEATHAEVHWYPVGHSFFSPSLADYHAHSAQLAWNRTVAFLRRELDQRAN